MNAKKSILNLSRRTARRYRIVGGKPVEKKNLYPWMTALCTRDALSPLDTQFCGGSLIAPNWVLTAAHCVHGEDDPQHLCVVLGLLLLDEPPQEKINIDKVIIHPKYDPDTSDFDVALLHLAEASKQKPIELIPAGDPEGLTAPKKMATIIGWGALSEGGGGSRQLMHAEVPIISNADANQLYGGDITKNMIAAGFLEGGIDACQGDSGGPFVVKDADLNLVLAGATSWGIGCAQPKYPGVYANLAVLGDWVRTTIG